MLIIKHDPYIEKENKLLDNYEKKLFDCSKNMAKLLVEVETSIKDCNSLYKTKLVRRTINNKEIIRFVDYYIEEGFSEDEAIFVVADDLDERPERVDLLWKWHKNKKKPILEYARRYALVKMRQCGINQDEICRFLDITPRYLRELDRKNLILR